jgi:hypothetical protein
VFSFGHGAAVEVKATLIVTLMDRTIIKYLPIASKRHVGPLINEASSAKANILKLHETTNKHRGAPLQVRYYGLHFELQ